MLRPALGAAIVALAMLPAANAAAVTAVPSPSPTATATPKPTPTPKPYNYAIIGDAPYGAASLAKFPANLKQINEDPTIHLVVHLGDIKNGSSRCDTSYYQQIKGLFDTVTRPLIYTPGDNEWTDCHRSNNGAYQPAGPVDTTSLAPAGPIRNGVAVGQPGANVPSRLSEIRRIFYPTPGKTLGQRTRNVAAQTPNFPENQRWTEISRGVTGGVIHVVGSNNNLLPWFDAAETPALKALRLSEASKRNAASLRFLDNIFNRAEADNSKGVVIGIQADMWDPFVTSNPLGYSGFTEFVQKLAARTLAFGKPVLLLNGDSHIFGTDKPLADPTSLKSTIYGITQPVPNLTRITVDGSDNFKGYTRLTIDPQATELFTSVQVPFKD